MIGPVAGWTTTPAACRAISLISLDRILSLRNPFDVARFIILSVVRSADDILRPRAWTYISKEGCKVFEPRPIHANSLSSVPFIDSAIRIVATLHDLSPTEIRSPSPFTFPGTAMCSQVRVLSFASTTLRDSFTQAPRGHFLLFTAKTTSAKPHSSGSSVLHSSVFKYLPRTKCLPSQVDQTLSSHHPILRCKA